MGGGVWMSLEEGNGPRVTGTGIQYRLTLLKTGPVRFAPRFRLGIEHRRRAPDSGTGGMLAAGAELAVWLGTRVQVALYGERASGFGSVTRNDVGVVLRLARIL